MQELQGENLKKAINDYVIDYSLEVGMSPRTIQNKKELLNRLLLFLNGRPYTLATARSFAAELFQTWKTPNSRLDLIRMIRAFTNFLHKRKYISESFANELTKPKVPQKPFDYVAPELVEKLIEAGTNPTPRGVKGDNSRNRAIKNEVRLAMRFALRTGLRISELISLRGDDLNLYDNPVTFWVNSKGGDRDLLPFPKDMIEDFIPRLRCEKLFKITAKTCNVALKRGARKLGVKAKLTCHSLRHIFASNMVKQGVPIQKVQRLMRHSSVEITDKTYTHLNVNDLSLVMNQQPIVRNGLDPKQIFESLEQAVKQSGVEDDDRFHLEIQRGTLEFSFVVRLSQKGQ